MVLSVMSKLGNVTCISQVSSVEDLSRAMSIKHVLYVGGRVASMTQTRHGCVD